MLLISRNASTASVTCNDSLMHVYYNANDLLIAPSSSSVISFLPFCCRHQIQPSVFAMKTLWTKDEMKRTKKTESCSCCFRNHCSLFWFATSFVAYANINVPFIIFAMKNSWEGVSFWARIIRADVHHLTAQHLTWESKGINSQSSSSIASGINSINPRIASSTKQVKEKVTGINSMAHQNEFIGSDGK